MNPLMINDPIRPHKLIHENLNYRLSRDNSSYINYILNEYDESPFKGPSFILPGGSIASEDMWRSSLEMRLDDINDKDLYKFSLYKFLKEKIDLEGSKSDKQFLREYYYNKNFKNKLSDIWNEFYLTFCYCIRIILRF